MCFCAEPLLHIAMHAPEPTLPMGVTQPTQPVPNTQQYTLLVAQGCSMGKYVQENSGKIPFPGKWEEKVLVLGISE